MGAARNKAIANAIPAFERHRAEEVPVVSRFVRVNGARVRVLEQGEGEPVLFLHGVGGWAEHWQGVLPALAREGFRAIACDLPGFGRSAPPRQVRYLDPPDPYYARFVRGLADRLALDRVNLVGHSLGGTIAAVTTMCFPELIRRLVLVAPGGFGQALPPRLRLCGLPVFPKVARLAPEGLFRKFVRGDFHDPARVPEWFYEDALKYCRAGATTEVGRVMSQLVTLRGPRPSLRQAWLKRAADIPCPTLVLWGRNDRTVPMGDLKHFECIANAQSKVIEEAGHLLMLEQPAVFQENLVSFLKGGTAQPCERERPSRRWSAVIGAGSSPRPSSGGSAGSTGSPSRPSRRKSSASTASEASSPPPNS